MNVERVRQVLDELDRTLSPTERERLRRYGSSGMVYLLYAIEVIRYELGRVKNLEED